MSWLLLLACVPPHLDLGGPFGPAQVPGLSAGPDDTIRFLVVGDIGERLDPEPAEDQKLSRAERLTRPHPAQSTIAASARQVCEDQCDFVAVLGDNVYPSGIRGGERGRLDRILLESSVGAYGAPLSYLVLGNHDWGPGMPSRRRVHRQLAHIEAMDTWQGSHHFYAFDAGPVRVVALDTNYLVRRPHAMDDPMLQSWIEAQFDPTRWTVVLGHHPLRSVGHHGDVGHYTERGLRLWQGRTFEAWTEEVVVGRADAYFAGHEHNLQFFELEGATKSTAAVVSGSAAECSHPPKHERGRVEPAFLRNGYGFVLVDVSPEKMTIAFHGFDGAPLWSSSRTRTTGWTGSAPDVDRDWHCQEDAEKMLELQRASP